MLETLNLSGNQFMGKIPSSISHLTVLKHLKLYDNQLEGHLPAHIFENCLYLEEINISQNKLTGSYPLSLFSKCTRMKRIHIGYNNFHGELKLSSISELKDLEFLYVNHNNFTGIIEPEICQLHELRFINFSNNHINGILPEEFGNLKKLEICILSDNHIEGPVPRSMSMLTNLRDFHIFNQFRSEHMELPREFKSYTYHRLYHDSLKLHIDSLCWLDRFAQEEAIEKKQASSSPKNGKRKKTKKKDKKNKKDRENNNNDDDDLDLITGGKMEDEMSLEMGSSIELASSNHSSLLQQTVGTASSHTMTTQQLDEIKEQFKEQEQDTSHRIKVNR